MKTRFQISEHKNYSIWLIQKRYYWKVSEEFRCAEVLTPWSIPMADPTYIVPGAAIHSFLMFAPFFAIYEKKGMVIQAILIHLLTIYRSFDHIQYDGTGFYLVLLLRSSDCNHVVVRT